MPNPCDYPIDLHGIASSPASIPDRKVLYTGYAFLVDTAFACPITGIVFKAGDLIFWDEAYSNGTWRVMRDLLEETFYTWDAVWTCPLGPWSITLQSISPTGVVTPWYRVGDNFRCVTTSSSAPSAPDHWLRPVYAYFWDSECGDNEGSITCSMAPVIGGTPIVFTIDAVNDCWIGSSGVFLGNFLPGIYRFTYLSGASKAMASYNWNQEIRHVLENATPSTSSTHQYGWSVRCDGSGYATYEEAESAWSGTTRDVEIC